MHSQSQSCMKWAQYRQVYWPLDKSVMVRSSASDRKTTFTCTKDLLYFAPQFHAHNIWHCSIVCFGIVLLLCCSVFLYFELCILCVALLCQGPRVNKVFLQTEEQVILLKKVLISPIHRKFLSGFLFNELQQYPDKEHSFISHKLSAKNLVLGMKKPCRFINFPP